jgi:hypothetical protein
MSPATLAGLALSILFLISNSANASSIDLSATRAVSSGLNLGAVIPARSGSARAIPMNTAALDVSSLQFRSSITEVGPGSPGTSAASSTGRSLGVATGVYVSRGAVAPRCIVNTPDPAPSVAPEPTSALLLGLGLVALYCVGRLRGWTLGHRA